MGKTPLLLLIATATVTLLVGQTTDTPAYTWSKTGPLQVARQGACVAALPDGRILVAGGQDVNGSLRSVELYQQDGTFSPAREMLRARAGHTCTSLPDGRILVAGGLGEGPAVQAETYDPVTNSWTPAEAGAERWNHTAVLLPDGRVLLAGGETSDGPTGLLEWFNPFSNHIRPLPGNLTAARTLHAAAVLPDGSVLVTGGWNAQNLIDSAEIVGLDGTIKDAPTLPAARAGHTATALDTGCILLAGGVGVDGDLKSTSLYCPDSGTFQSAPDMSVPRFGHLAVSLPDNGNVLVTGGFSQGEATAVSELYDPVANTFQPVGSLTLARLGIAAAADPTTGAVLAVGGYTADGPLAACGILRIPTAAFDKARYVDGDAVTVSGLGWTPGESVKLALSTQPFARSGLLLPASFQNFQVTASPLGRIQLTLFNASASAAGATFKITATGVTSGLTAGSSARQISRTNVTLNVFPFPALTRQPVTLQAVVQPATALDPLDGTVTFLLGATPLGTVSSTTQFTTVSSTGQITDGTSNTIQFGETLPSNGTGFGSVFMAGDGSVRTINPGGAFQLVTRDIPAGSGAILSLSGPSGSVTGSYTPINSLYAPASITGTVSVQKRAVNVTVRSPVFVTVPKVGDPIQLTGAVSPTERPLADVAPAGNLHFGLAPGNVVDVPLSPTQVNAASSAVLTVRLPAGTRTFSAQYDGDSVYLPGGVSGSGSVTVGKGTVGFALIPSKSSYTVGESITLVGRILHPKVPGATPTGQITRTAGPTQFQGATVGGDSQNTGIIDTKLPVAGFPSAGNITLTMSYAGDANFLPATAGTILSISKATPQITVIPPAQIVAGQPATFVVRAAPQAGLSGPSITGQVTFSGIANGSSANLVASTGSSVGTIRQTFPAAGTFSIIVLYAGDANYLAAASIPVQVVVQ